MIDETIPAEVTRGAAPRRLTRRALLATATAGVGGLVVGGELLQRRDAQLQTQAYLAMRKGPRAAGGWQVYAGNPVLGRGIGTCFDVCLLPHGSGYRMWFSWRDRRSIALVESHDGVHWGAPRIALGPAGTGWEEMVNRPSVQRTDRGYEMWYTGQAGARSSIGHAISTDGVLWTRRHQPVFTPVQNWEQDSVMCPDVMWDAATGSYRMWYSAGFQGEPNAIGYAASGDGVHWVRPFVHPIFSPDSAFGWERERVTACHVVRQGAQHVMFYIGFRDVYTAQIGMARSADGIHDWQRHPANPIIRLGKPGSWDADAVYKPFALPTHDGWALWFNGRHGAAEQIGLAVHRGRDLGFG